MFDQAEQLNMLQREYARLAINEWLTSSALTWNWWFLVFFLIVLYL